MTSVLDQIKQAKESIDRSNDKLLDGFLRLQAIGSITVLPMGDETSDRPVILIPQAQYDRMVKRTAKSGSVNPE